MRLALAAVAALLLIAFCALRWKESTKALIYLVIFEGALRKWFLPSLSSELYLLKDVVMVGALLGWAVNRTPALPRSCRDYYLPHLAFIAWGLLQIMNPSMSSIIGGVFGLKAYVLWAAYPILLMAALRTRDNFEKYVRQILLVAIPVCLLAVIQSRLPPDSFLNVYARDRAQVDTYGGEALVRVTGTFPYLAGFSNFLIFIAVIALPFAFHRGTKKNLLLCLILFPLLLGTSFMTGSRWPVFFLAIFAAGFLGTVAVTNAASLKRAKKLVLPMVASVLAMFFLFRSSLSGWVERVDGAIQSGDSLAARSFDQFLYILDPAIFSVFGDGIGSTNNAAQAIGDILQMPVRPSNKPVEAEPGRVMAELGAPGFLLWYGLRVYLIVRLFGAARRIKEPFLKSLAIAGGWFVLVGIMAPVPFDTSLAAFYWLTAGFAVLLPYLEKNPGVTPSPAARRCVMPQAKPGIPLTLAPPCA